MDELAETLLNRLKSTNVAAIMKLQDTLRQVPAIIEVGTACSGTDLVIGALNAIARAWRALGISVSFNHAFAADVKEVSRDFIKANWKPEVVDYLVLSPGSGWPAALVGARCPAARGGNGPYTGVSDRGADAEGCKGSSGGLAQTLGSVHTGYLRRHRLSRGRGPRLRDGHHRSRQTCALVCGRFHV